MKTEAQKQAEKEVKAIDYFIRKQKELNPYSFASLIMIRLLKQCDESDIEDIFFELKYDTKPSDDVLNNLSDLLEVNGRKVFKCDSLAEDIKFENFLNELKANPYQLNLV